MLSLKMERKDTKMQIQKCQQKIDSTIESILNNNA